MWVTGLLDIEEVSRIIRQELNINDKELVGLNDTSELNHHTPTSSLLARARKTTARKEFEYYDTTSLYQELIPKLIMILIVQAQCLRSRISR